MDTQTVINTFQNRIDANTLENSVFALAIQQLQGTLATQNLELENKYKTKITDAQNAQADAETKLAEALADKAALNDSLTDAQNQITDLTAQVETLSPVDTVDVTPEPAQTIQ